MSKEVDIKDLATEIAAGLTEYDQNVADEIKTIVDRIVDNKGTIIAITSINDSYLRKRANYCLTMCSKENIVSKPILQS